MAIKKQYIVKHPGIYFSVGGKLQKVDVGGSVELSDEAAKKLLSRRFVTAVSEKPAVVPDEKTAKKTS